MNNYITNKEFQDILAKYPDDYVICMDNVYGWESATIHRMCKPELYVNTDIGQIEIEFPEYIDPWHHCDTDKPRNGETVLVRYWYDGYKYVTGDYDAENDRLICRDSDDVIGYVRFEGDWMYIPDEAITD